MLITVLEDFVIILKHNKRNITFDNLIVKISMKIKNASFQLFHIYFSFNSFDK
jgi:hypothetical protein